jgi:hypothetical protein
VTSAAVEGEDNPWRGRSPREARAFALLAARRQRTSAEGKARKAGEDTAVIGGSVRANARRARPAGRQVDAAEGESFEGRNPRSAVV